MRSISAHLLGKELRIYHHITTVCCAIFYDLSLMFC